MTQNEEVLEWLKKWGCITPAEAYEELGIMRLSARIHDLRGYGHAIKSENVTRPNRNGKKVTFSRYIYDRDAEKNL